MGEVANGGRVSIKLFHAAQGRATRNDVRSLARVKTR